MHVSTTQRLFYKFSYHISRNELSLIDYLTTIGNFDASFIETGLYSNGYFDLYNVGTTEYLADRSEIIKKSRVSVVDNEDGRDQIFEFQYSPGVGILNSSKPLVPGCEVKLSFDRANIQLGLIQKNTNELELPKKLSLTNLYCKARYFSSPILRTKFKSIQENDLHYRYDECSVYLKNLPKGETNIRLNNVFGGSTPSHIFCGVIKSEALSGDLNLSSTRFELHDVTEIDMTLNGYSVCGYPIQNINGSALSAYTKWLKTTNRKFNNKCGRQISPVDFKNFHFVYSHAFEGDETEQGWVGIELKLRKPYEENYTLGRFNKSST